MRLSFFGAAVLVFLPLFSGAETCQTNCHDQCRVRTDFPPMNFIEPTCHAKCEVAKQAACATKTDIPDIPITPIEQGKIYGTQACAATFQTITGVVIARCSNWDGRLDNQPLIDDAMNLLQNAGIMSPGELNGVQVRWCPLSNGHGMAPDRGRIYLDTSLQGNRIRTASTLAHELTHIRQYRRLGTDRFKCDYSRQYTECGGCQDRRNAFEREAYDFENSIASRLSQVSPPQTFPQPYPSPTFPPPGIPVRFCQTQWGTCQLPPVMAPMGASCYCYLNGQQIPGSAF